MTSSEAGTMSPYFTDEGMERRRGEVGAPRTHVVSAVAEPGCPGLEPHL